MGSKFQEIDHSGDVGIEAFGADFAELLANATAGLFALQYRGTVAAVSNRPIRVVSESLEDLVVDWLSEVIAIGGTHGELFGAVAVLAVSGDGSSVFEAEGVLRGERFDADRHDPRFDVKAATYHGLHVTREKGKCGARIIFDL
jgi:SHS2 domain-containing protein